MLSSTAAKKMSKEKHWKDLAHSNTYSNLSN
jgi:hypothetical protein